MAPSTMVRGHGDVVGLTVADDATEGAGEFFFLSKLLLVDLGSLGESAYIYFHSLDSILKNCLGRRVLSNRLG